MASSLEKYSSYLLGIGVILSATITLYGALLFLISHAFDQVSLVTEEQLPLIKWGIALLILVPIFRVFASIFLFAKEGDLLYAFLSFLVFSILVYTFIT